MMHEIYTEEKCFKTFNTVKYFLLKTKIFSETYNAIKKLLF